jgi:putative FmdB family regulatory protein
VAPFIEYVCACTNEFELLRRFSDEDKDVECPNCGRVGKVQRAVSIPMQARVPGASGAGKQSHLPR